MSVTSSHYSSSSGLSNMDRSAVGHMSAQLAATDEAGVPLTVTLAPDLSSMIVTANGSDKRSILQTCAKAGIELKDGDLTVDALQRVLDYAQIHSPGEPWVAALSQGMDDLAEQYKVADPVGYAKALKQFLADGKKPPMSLFDLMLYLGDKFLDCSIALIQTGASIKAQSMRVIVKASADSAEQYKEQSRKTQEGGAEKFNAELAGSVLSLGIAVGSTGAGLKGAQHSSKVSDAENHLQLSKINAQGAQPGELRVGNQTALANYQTVSKSAMLYKTGADSGMPLAQGINGAAGAAGTTAETGIQTANLDAQSNISDNQAKSADAEAAKSSGEQTSSQGTDSAHSSLSTVQNALSSIAESTGKAAGAA